MKNICYLKNLKISVSQMIFGGVFALLIRIFGLKTVRNKTQVIYIFKE